MRRPLSLCAPMQSMVSTTFPRILAIKLSGNFEFDPEFAIRQPRHALAANSPALGAGAALTYTTGDGQVACLPVEDAAFFTMASALQVK